MLATKAEEKKLDLVLDYAPGVPRQFVGDGGRIRQVVTNLVGNAIKFTPRGHVVVTVACDPQEGLESQMRVSVTDTGIGIPADKIAVLFEQFSQVDASTTRNYGGTGLGLAISKRLVNLMGGAIGVTSRPGAGSTFWFTLPLPLDSQPNAAPVSVDELRGTRVLIVDDDEVNRRVLHEQVMGWGMRCGSCASGEEALDALRAAQLEGDPYSIAIIDHQMPGMDGAALAAIIKDDPATRDTVVGPQRRQNWPSTARSLKETLTFRSTWPGRFTNSISRRSTGSLNRERCEACRTPSRRHLRNSIPFFAGGSSSESS